MQTELLSVFIRLFSVSTCLESAVVTEAAVTGTQCTQTLPQAKGRGHTALPLARAVLAAEGDPKSLHW